MCGIMGFVAPPGTQADVAVFETIVRSNMTRGTRGYGIGIWGPGGSTIIRENAEIHTDIVEPAIRFGNVCAIHTRAPTGMDIGAAGLHPFSTSTMHLAHNGLLINWNREPFDRWRHVACAGKFSRLNVDSGVLAAGIQYMTDNGDLVHEAISGVMEEVEGQVGCWLYEEEEQALYLWRVMSTIYLRKFDGVTYFSSAMGELFQASDLLKEGRIYRVGGRLSKPEATVVGTFKYKSPYEVGEATIVRDI